MASWRTRYFVLRGGPDPLLVYYRETRRGTGPPAGVLRLAGGQVGPADGVAGSAAFAVEADGRTYFLRAASAGQRQHWVDSIAAAVRGGAAAAAAHAAAAAQAAALTSPFAPSGSPSPARRRGSAFSEAALPSPLGPAASPLHARRSSSGAASLDVPPSPASGASTPGSSAAAAHPAKQSRRSLVRATKSWTAALFPHSTSSGSEAAAPAAEGRIAARPPAGLFGTPGGGTTALLAAAAAAADAADAYSANLPALGGGRGGRKPLQALMAGAGAGLPLESLAEHYQR